MDVNRYIEERLDPQIKWYDLKSLKCQKHYKRIQTIEIIIAALIPLFSGYTSYHFVIPIIIGFMGVVIAILESVSKLNKYHEYWIEYRSTCEMLKYQKHLYLTHSAPYNNQEETIDNLFVRNIEQIVSSENNQWKNLNEKINMKPQKNHQSNGS